MNLKLFLISLPNINNSEEVSPTVMVQSPWPKRLSSWPKRIRCVLVVFTWNFHHNLLLTKEVDEVTDFTVYNVNMFHATKKKAASFVMVYLWELLMLMGVSLSCHLWMLRFLYSLCLTLSKFLASWSECFLVKKLIWKFNIICYFKWI